MTVLSGNELLLPWLRGDRSEEASRGYPSLRSSIPELLEDTFREMQLTEQRRPQRERAKTNVLQCATDFFTRGHEASLVQPLAAMLGQKPGSVDEPACFQRGDGSLLAAGSSCYFPADGPLTKYEALFDPIPCFEGFRWSCMVAADPDMQVRTFRQAVLEMLV